MLAIPSRREMAGVARVLMSGSLVAIGTADEVDEARANLAEFDNVMFLDARPDSIPWRDAYFTKILVPTHLEPLLRSAAAELHRLLAPGGEIVTGSQDC
jgi:hypothetical protein